MYGGQSCFSIETRKERGEAYSAFKGFFRQYELTYVVGDERDAVIDDRSICLSMSRLLRAIHYHPIAYLSAEAFLSDTNRPMFACLVLDIQLKGMSGLDLSERLYAVRDFTPIVFITAQDNPEVQELVKATDYAGYFSKTDSGEDVLSVIRRAIGVNNLIMDEDP